MGCTADELSRRITQRELGEWLVRGKPLWPRRLEVLLAQLAAVVAKVGGNSVELSDFDLFAPKEAAQPMTASEGATTLGALAGGVGTRMLGSKRRQLEQQAEKQAHGLESR